VSKYFLKSTIPVYMPLREIPEGFVEEGPGHPCLHVRHMTIDELLSFDADGPGKYGERVAELVNDMTGDFYLVPANDLPPSIAAGRSDMGAYRASLAEWLNKSLHFKALGALVRTIAAANRLSEKEGN
jgi:hypothetical protein